MALLLPVCLGATACSLAANDFRLHPRAGTRKGTHESAGTRNRGSHETGAANRRPRFVGRCTRFGLALPAALPTMYAVAIRLANGVEHMSLRAFLLWVALAVTVVPTHAAAAPSACPDPGAVCNVQCYDAYCCPGEPAGLITGT
jgi:hypothetical protein